MREVRFTPSPRVLVGLDAIGRYLHVSRRTAWRWIQEYALPAMQTPARTWMTTTSLIDLWIIAESGVRWEQQKTDRLPPEAPTAQSTLTVEP
jgi:hypothetical protein